MSSHFLRLLFDHLFYEYSIKTRHALQAIDNTSKPVRPQFLALGERARNFKICGHCGLIFSLLMAILFVNNENIFTYFCICGNMRIYLKGQTMKKAELSRITIDIPKTSHKKLKAMAALQGVSMREVINNLIDQQILGDSAECPHGHIPNKKTTKVLKNIKEGKNLVKAENVQELLKKLGL